MPELVLGVEVMHLSVLLAAGSAFVQEILLEADTWAAGDQLELRFDTGDVWAATLSGATARWDKPGSTVDAVLAKKPHGVGLWFTNGEAVLWGRGPVTVQ